MAPSNTNVHTDNAAFKGLLPAGLITGLLGGSLMIALAIVYVTSLGMPFMRPLEWIAAAIYGEQALYRDDMNVVWTGLVLHLLTSFFWAIFFALFTSKRDSTTKALGVGMAFGAVIWVIMTYFVLPFIDPVMSTEVTEVPLVWFALHLVYGATLALTPALSRRFGGNPRPLLRAGEGVPSGHSP